MPARPERPQRHLLVPRGVAPLRHLRRGVLVGALGMLGAPGCASERSEPAGAPEVSTVEDVPASPAQEAEAEAPGAAPTGVEGTASDLASVEAALADYEARLARAGVAVPRSAARLGGGSVGGEDGAGAATATPLDDATGGSRSASKSEAKHAETDASKDARDQAQRPARRERANKKKPRETRRSERKSRSASGKSDDRGAGDLDGEFAPPPPGDAPDPGVVGGALAEELDPEAEASRLDPRPRCEELCSLEEAICALETRVCDLAESHRWDRRYVEACTRAGEDCSAAREACETCTPEDE